MEEYWNPMVPELSVSNFANSIDFYCEIIGFKIRNQRKEPDFAYLELEQIHDEAWVTGELVWPLGRGVNFQIELSDIVQVYERVKASNITLFRELKETW
ncbi:TPA: VOC family protein, partial [Vibrio vulnificus]